MNIDLITPSFAPDFERCRFLCESIDKYVTGLKNHLIVVDRQDLPLFKVLESSKCSIVVKEDILPHWLHHLPLSRRWWISSRSLPVRGWILQQIVKLSAAEWSSADIFMFADSDVFFVRAFDCQSTLQENRVRLFRSDKKKSDLEEPRHKNWDRAAARFFQLTGKDHNQFDYISQLNTWRRDVLMQMTNQIEYQSGRPWKQVLCNTWDFSEFVLYGTYSDFVLGAQESGHFLDKKELCNCSWHHDIDDESSIRKFINTTMEHQSAILMQSNLSLHLAQYRSLL